METKKKRKGREECERFFGTTEKLPIIQKTASSCTLLEAVIFIIAVPLKLTLTSTHFMYYHTRRIDNGPGSRRHLLSVRSQPRKSIPQMLPCRAHTARGSLKCSLSEYSSFSSVSLCFLYCTPIKQKSQPFYNNLSASEHFFFARFIFRPLCLPRQTPRSRRPFRRPQRRLSDPLPHPQRRVPHPRPYCRLRRSHLFLRP